MSQPDPEIARAAIFEIIENQIRDDTPPETKQTYDRLVADGHPHEETMKKRLAVLCETGDWIGECHPQAGNHEDCTSLNRQSCHALSSHKKQPAQAETKAGVCSQLPTAPLGRLQTE